MDFSQGGAVPVTVHTGSTRATSAGSNPFASNAWGTANLAIYCPIILPFRYPVRNLFVYNFATVNGNVDVGIYSEDFVRLTPSVATTQTGASALQFFAVDILLRPGQYYLAMSSSSTTGTYAIAPIGSATRQRYFGLLQQGTAYPLPAAATPAVKSTNAFIPGIGMTYLSGTPAF
jgi:hypothetical protein